MELKNNFNGKYFVGNRKNSKYEESKIIIFPIGYEGTVSYNKGTINGPEAIINASQYLENYDEEFEIELNNIHTFKISKFDENIKIETALDFVYENSKKILNDNKFPLMIGGEHSLTLGLVRALKEKYNEFTIIQIDAHTDLDESYNNNKYSHASVMKRINEIENINIIQLGIRTITKEIHQFVKNNNQICTIFSHEIKQMPISKLIEKLIPNIKKNVFITIDVDGFDPHIFPNTGTPEPNGLEWQYTINLFKQILKEKNIIGLDFMEFSSNKQEHYSDFSAAKLIFKLLCLIESNKKTI